MTERALPPELQSIRSLLPEWVAGLERRSPYAAVLATSSEGLQITVTDRESRVNESQRGLGAAFTAWSGGFPRERAVGSLVPGDLAAAAHSLRQELVPQPGPGPAAGAPCDRHFALPAAIDPQSKSPRDKLELCRSIHSALHDLEPRIVYVMVAYSERAEAKVFASRTRLLSQTLTRICLQVDVVVSDGQKMQRDWLRKAGTGGLEIAQVADEELQTLAESAVSLLNAERIEPGAYDLVCDPSVAGLLAHEAFGHGVETDMFLQGRARAATFLGKRVGSTLVNLIDDPTVPAAHGSYFFDDEGQLAAPTPILREGVFLQGLSDLFSAFRLGIPRTANGRREGHDHKAYARMSNTYFAPGAAPVADLIGGLERGVLLRKGSGGMEDPRGWGVQIEAHIGEEVVSGRRTGRLFSPVALTGFVPDVLSSISAVGDELALDGGNCAKGFKEWTEVSSGGPHLRLRARLG